MRTHRAAVLTAPRSVAFQRAALPELAPTRVRVRLEGCGVCGSNLPVWEGRPWFTYPLAAGAPGHEGWGVVDAVGASVSTVREGDRVALLSYNAFAEYDVAESDHLVRLPEALRGRPFPGEALGCAMNVFRRSEISRGQTVAIVGIGFLGALLVSLAASAGARVVALSRRPFALEIARRMGAAETIAMDDPARCIGAVLELTGGAGCERVIEATGQQQPLDLAGELTAERGRLVVAGYHQDGPRQVNMQLWNWRGLDVINAHERDPRVYVEGIRAAAEAVAAGTLDPTPLYTHRFGLDDLPRALDAMSDRSGSFLKSVVMYD
ncbi:L-iditol 2-dehydrogenase [Opitutaceae bacterium EW11]|nr:L-iditol 2-dehydrogenase [Opitutaceae bacterium EW11]